MGSETRIFAAFGGDEREHQVSNLFTSALSQDRPPAHIGAIALHDAVPQVTILVVDEDQIRPIQSLEVEKDRQQSIGKGDRLVVVPEASADADCLHAQFIEHRAHVDVGGGDQDSTSSIAPWIDWPGRA